MRGTRSRPRRPGRRDRGGPSSRRSEEAPGGLVDAAGRAESGALARLLASMSASVTQHLATLPPPEVARMNRARGAPDHARGRARRGLRLRPARVAHLAGRRSRSCTSRCARPTRRTASAATRSSARSRRRARPRRRPLRRTPRRPGWTPPTAATGGAGARTGLRSDLRRAGRGDGRRPPARGDRAPRRRSGPRTVVPGNSRDIPRSRRVRGPLRRTPGPWRGPLASSRHYCAVLVTGSASRSTAQVCIADLANVVVRAGVSRSAPAPADSSGISSSDCTTASGSPSVWPTCCGGIVLCGRWIAFIPAW